MDADRTLARLQAWRAQGADRLDPLRFALLEALAVRAPRHAGRARMLLDERLAVRLEAYARDLERAAATTEAAEHDPLLGYPVDVGDDGHVFPGVHRGAVEHRLTGEGAGDLVEHRAGKALLGNGGQDGRDVEGLRGIGNKCRIGAQVDGIDALCGKGHL